MNNLPPAATHDGTVRRLVAIELSRKSWIVAVSTPLSAKISRYGLKGWNDSRATRADRIVTILPNGTAMAWGNLEVFSMFHNFEQRQVEAPSESARWRAQTVINLRARLGLGPRWLSGLPDPPEMLQPADSRMPAERAVAARR